MSHFMVAVFTNGGKTVDELLDPYDENITVPKYRLYTREELIQDERKNLEDYYTTTYAKYLSDPKGYLANVCGGNRNSQHYIYVSEEFPKRYRATDEELLKRVLLGFNQEDVDANGDVYSTCNPKAKWDWWSYGGRFSDMLVPVDDEEPEDEMPVRNIDFAAMEARELAELEPYPSALISSSSGSKYLERMYPDEETYKKIRTSFWTRAVVTPDGAWHEVGEMGWFGCSSEEPEDIIKWVDAYWDTFMKPALEKNWNISIVDCHI